MKDDDTIVSKKEKKEKKTIKDSKMSVKLRKRDILSQYSNKELLSIVAERTSKKDALVLDDGEKVYELMCELALERNEHFYLLTLDNGLRLIKKHLLHIGTETQSLVSAKDILVKALEDDALNFIMVHNHPTGTLTPSRNDDKVTQRLKDGGDLIGIQLLDHVIVSSQGFYSYQIESRIV